MPQDSTPSAAMKERRKHPRTETFWRGMLRTSSKVLDCRIVDVSAEGAQLRLVTPQIGAAVGVSESVMLTVEGIGRVMGRVVWQRKSSIGLHFTDPHTIAVWSAAIATHARDKRGRLLGTKLPAERPTG